jgi:shikimate 5-dehydrogenase
MKQYVSVSQYPGKTGTYFYNKFFKHYNMDAHYRAHSCDDIEQFIKQSIDYGISGISVSMPYKQQVIPLLTEFDAYVLIYNSCNTITVNGEIARGYNADICGVEHVCRSIEPGSRITILGAGAVGSMFIKYLEENGYCLNVCARSLNTWEHRFMPADVVINCTALGTSTTDSPYQIGQLHPDVKLVIDLAIKDNDFKSQCLAKEIKYISGREFYKAQFLNQFKIYTSIVPDSDLYDQFEREFYEKV